MYLNKENIKMDDKWRKILKFEEEMQDSFSQKSLDFLICNLGVSSYKDTSLLEAIYSYLELIPYSKDRYRWFANFISDVYGTDGNILEVGCGIFPALAFYLDELQRRRGKGTITAYDPYLFKGQLGNVKAVRKKFDEKESLKNYDLIIGMKPCNATSMIIRRANDAIKPFAIIQCDCSHEGDYYDEADETLPRDMILNEILLPHSYEVYSPLIYTQNIRTI